MTDKDKMFSRTKLCYLVIGTYYTNERILTSYICVCEKSDDAEVIAKEWEASIPSNLNPRSFVIATSYMKDLHEARAHFVPHVEQDD